MGTNISPISNEALCVLSEELSKNNRIDPRDFDRYGVKRGLRNSDGTGVMAGLTNICNVHGYVINDGERVPLEGQLIYRGINVDDLVAGCQRENRFGFEEMVWLLLFGYLPTSSQLDFIKEVLADCRELPGDFIEDMIMKAPSANIMNKLGRSVLALYSYDPDPEDTSLRNVLRQCLQLIAQMPTIMACAYQVKRRVYDHHSMYLHPLKKELSTAENILRIIRADKQFTDEEAKLLDICLMLHAEHGGGNNSTFATRVLTSSGTDTYSALSAAIGSLKGPRHGGANIKVSEMLEHIKQNVEDWGNDDEVCEYLSKLIRKEGGDGSGLIYGMGHAIYTLYDPRAKILKEHARKLAEEKGELQEFLLIDAVERLTPEVFATVKGDRKVICANVDLYSGFVYRMLKIPPDLFTPLFAVARMPGWCAHRLEELTTGGRIIRPAYKSVCRTRRYVPLDERTGDRGQFDEEYIPRDERKDV